MLFDETILLKNGMKCRLRNGTEADGAAVYENFRLTHGQTDYLLSYPDEITFDAAQEGRFLQQKAESAREAEILAEIDGEIVGTAGVDAVGAKDKLRHRAEFGVSVDERWWGLGIGRALMNACIDCARRAGYVQLELSVVAGNEHALEMYRSAGFVEYGRNPRGFRSRTAGDQELVLMRLEL